MINGFVYVIESPSDSDLLDGRTEGRSLCEALHLADIPFWYSLATSLKTFEQSLGTRLTEALSKFNQIPILHLSMHGNNDGVSLTDGTFISWSSLQKILAPLTNAVNGKLLICMSSCFGSSGCRMAMHEEKDLPFWALLGNSSSTLWSDASVAYITFYHLFFKGIQIQECVKRMQLASNDNNFFLWEGHVLKEKWGAYMEKSRKDQLVEALRNYSTTNTGTLSGLLS